MDSEKQSSKNRSGVDWRNTSYQFHFAAVQKYNLTSREIAMFSALMSIVSTKDVVEGYGKAQLSNSMLMQGASIKNNAAFRKARDRLIETGIIYIERKGTVQRENTIYRVKLIGSPKPK